MRRVPVCVWVVCAHIAGFPVHVCVLSARGTLKVIIVTKHGGSEEVHADIQAPTTVAYGYVTNSAARIFVVAFVVGTCYCFARTGNGSFAWVWVHECLCVHTHVRVDLQANFVRA